MPTFRQRTIVTANLDFTPGAPAIAVPFRPATGGPLHIRADVGAGNCKVEAFLRDPRGNPVGAAYVGSLTGLTFDHALPDDVAPAGEPWTIRVRNTGTVPGAGALVIEYPAAFDRTLAPLDKLNDMASMALREVHLTGEVNGGAIELGCDRQFRKHLPEGWEHHTAQIHGITVTSGRIDTQSVRFVPPAADLPRGGLEVVLGLDDVRIKKGIGLGGVDHARLTLRAGLAVVRGRLTIDPVSVALTGDLKWLVWLLELIDAKERLSAAATAAVIRAIREPRGVALATTATSWVRRLLRMDELLDVRVTTEGLVLEYTTVAPVRPPLARPTPPLPHGRMKHLVVVMMENRSYDHMLADFFAKHPQLGIMPTFQASHGGQTYLFDKVSTSKVIDDPPHGKVAHQANAGGDWLGPYAAKHPARLGDAVSYQPRETVPTFDHLVQNAVVCRNWRASVPGSTWPNRNYALSGTSGGALDNGEGGFDLYDFLTVCDVLEAQAHPNPDPARPRWRYYRSDVTFLELYRRWALDRDRLRPVAEFHRACAHGHLPEVSWIEPNIADFGSNYASDDHPPADVKFGQGFLQSILESLAAYSARGNNDWLLVITYDEHGGFYDSAGFDDTHVADGDRGPHRRGFRVPAFFASPWLDPGVCDIALDHASIVRTILDRFCAPEPLLASVPRVDAAASFAELLDGIATPGWPVPRVAPTPFPRLKKLQPPDAFYPPAPLMSGPSDDRPAFERDDAETPEWRTVQARQRAYATARDQLMSGTAVDRLAVAPVALEGLHVELRGGRDPATLVPADWTVLPGLGGAATALLVPPKVPTLAEAWNTLNQLRRTPGVGFAEAMWEATVRADADDERSDTDHGWALELIRAPDAWRREPPSGTTRGAGVVIAHLDTGLTEHRDLDGAVLSDLGWDYVDEDATAVDPLQSGPGWFPGHGTATASVIVSRERDGGVLVGAAPEATLLPFRISRSVVHLSTFNMAKAIRRAVASGAHVISLSAGGLWSHALQTAVRDAAQAGVIVVAAAGNYSPIVAWPARFPEVISVGACDRQRRPWAFSSRGAAVDVTAPGVAVSCAKAGAAGSTAVRGGTGTSFATALTAGAVATWLSFWGRDALLARFGQRGLAAAARRAIMRAVRPLSAPAEGMGAGLLDLDTLLGLPLESPDFSTLMGAGPSAPPAERSEDIAVATTGDPNVLDDLPPIDRVAHADEIAFFGWLARQTTPATTWLDLARVNGSDALKALLPPP